MIVSIVFDRCDFMMVMMDVLFAGLLFGLGQKDLGGSRFSDARHGTSGQGGGDCFGAPGKRGGEVFVICGWHGEGGKVGEGNVSKLLFEIGKKS